jgi:hypothetical protein
LGPQFFAGEFAIVVLVKLLERRWSIRDFLGG